jgi:hypothetical protein
VACRLDAALGWVVGRTLEVVADIPMPADWPSPEGASRIFGVHLLVHVADNGLVYVAPMGTPPFPEEGLGVPAVVEPGEGYAMGADGQPTAWMLVGPLDDLPTEGYLADVRRAYWAAVMPDSGLPGA